MVKGKGSTSARSTASCGRARGVRARLRAAGDQGERAVRRRLSAVHRARPAADREAGGRVRAESCDTIAHGCTGKGNDQVRIESTVIALDPDMKIIAPVRGWQMGREQEIAYAREHGIPVKGGTEPPYSIDDNLWGRSSEGGDRGPRGAAARRRLQPRDASGGRSGRARGRGGRLRARLPGVAQRRVAGARGAAGAGRRDRRPARRRDRGPHRGPDRRPEGARPLRGSGRGDRPDRTRSSRSSSGRSTRTTSSHLDDHGPTSSTPGSGTSRSCPT